MPVLINALSTDDQANILSLPSVLVNNNETAIVKTEEERPTLQNTQNTTGTQTGAGAPRNAGITLEISPTISPNNYLRLNVSLEVSRFIGAFDPNSATGGGVTVRRTVKTQVTMPSDATMVLGGVIEDSESYSDGGVPFLKDIPVLGFLFRKSESTSNKTNLYFFVTPTILDEDDFQDLWHASLNKKLEAEKYIGNRRLQLIDRKWTGTAGAQARNLEDPGTTSEDLDLQGEYELPTYRRTTPSDFAVRPGTSTAPPMPSPQAPNGDEGRR
jgi:type II secretory pathway component GspD/PulD (secretin)